MSGHGERDQLAQQATAFDKEMRDCYDVLLKHVRLVYKESVAEAYARGFTRQDMAELQQMNPAHVLRREMNELRKYARKHGVTSGMLRAAIEINQSLEDAVDDMWRFMGDTHRKRTLQQ